MKQMQRSKEVNKRKYRYILLKHSDVFLVAQNRIPIFFNVEI